MGESEWEMYLGVWKECITGPGKVIVQTQPIAELALALHHLVPRDERGE